MILDNMGLATGSLGDTDAGLDLVRTAAQGDAHDQQPGLRAWARCHEATLLRRAGHLEEARLAASEVFDQAHPLEDAYALLNFEANLLYTRGLLGDDTRDPLDDVARRADGLRLAFVALKSRLFAGVLAHERNHRSEAESRLAGCLPLQLELGHLHVLAQELCPRHPVALTALSAAASGGRAQELMDTLALHPGFGDFVGELCADHADLAGLAVEAAGKVAPDAVLRRVLRTAERNGRSDVADVVARTRAARPGGRGRAAALLDLLTPREHEVLALMADGLRNPDIVARLVVSEATVKTHVTHIFAKLGVRTRVEAILLYHDALPLD